MSNDEFRTISTGRAAGIQAIEMAMSYSSQMDSTYVLLGGSDSYYNFSLLNRLTKEKRILTENSLDGFVPGEAAGFILLTTSIEKALNVNGNVVSVYSPGLSEEPGHLYSEKAYKGEGLSLAFKDALKGVQEHSIDCIYSSLNGESIWAKELGVASIRNNRFLKAGYNVIHPADCLGDMGAATAPVLLGLAAIELLIEPLPNRALVYSSSDLAARGAVLLEKYPQSRIVKQRD